MPRNMGCCSSGMQSFNATYFDALYECSNDPWGFRSRWYEQRKRSIVLACLDQPLYSRVFEPACANGELAAALAPRCQHLLASDFHTLAVGQAKSRLSVFPHVKVEQRRLPRDWPPGAFDLIVFGEIGYYLDREALRLVLRQSRGALTAGGSFVACHWRPAIEGAVNSGDDVHSVIRAEFAEAPLLSHLEDDFILELWSMDRRSVATREALR